MKKMFETFGDDPQWRVERMWEWRALPWWSTPLWPGVGDNLFSDLGTDKSFFWRHIFLSIFKWHSKLDLDQWLWIWVRVFKSSNRLDERSRLGIQWDSETKHVVQYWVQPVILVMATVGSSMRVSLMTFITALLLFFIQDGVSATQPPNIVLIVIDDLGKTITSGLIPRM